MAGFQPTPHPLLKLPTREQAIAMGPEKLRELLLQREEIIRLEREDPWEHGFYLDSWKDADRWLAQSTLLALLGGNGSAKTHYMCRKEVETALDNPGCKILMLHEEEEPSKILHQATIFHYLPKQLKELALSTKRSKIAKLSYTVANGFTDNKLVFPNGSLILFGFYKQDIAKYEGTGWKLICADENLPLKWLNTLLYRLPRAGGKFLWGFTPINGVTPAVRELMKGAQTLETQSAELLDQSKVHVPGCPKGRMPYVQKALWAETHIIFFPSKSNPYGGYEAFVKRLAGKSSIEIERRAYGYARDTVGGAFPKFSAAHVVPEEEMAKRLAGKGTRRHYADPAGRRNMFQIWVFTDEHDRHFIYREWPDVPTYGEWAIPSESPQKWDGDAGPAQQTMGLGIIGYKSQMLEGEGNTWNGSAWEMKGETLFERKFDPRSGKAGVITEQEGNVSLLQLMQEEQYDHAGNLVGPSMIFEQASGITEDQGIIAIQSLLEYNEGEPRVEFINEPRLYVSAGCKNVIWALQNYTQHDGEKAACKDPVDCVRYFATDDPCYVDAAAMRCSGGGSY